MIQAAPLSSSVTLSTFSLCLCFLQQQLFVELLCVPGKVLGTRITELNKTDKRPLLCWGAYFNKGEWIIHIKEIK